MLRTPGACIICMFSLSMRPGELCILTVDSLRTGREVCVSKLGRMEERVQIALLRHGLQALAGVRRVLQRIWNE